MSFFRRLLEWIRDLIRWIIELIRRLFGMDDDKPPLTDVPGCCNLRYPTGPWCEYSGSRSNFTCPPGFQRSWWFCCEGTRQVACAECSTGASCWSGPWNCSMWWFTGQSC
jgi:hypothetical protein